MGLTKAKSIRQIGDKLGLCVGNAICIVTKTDSIQKCSNTADTHLIHIYIDSAN